MFFHSFKVSLIPVSNWKFFLHMTASNSESLSSGAASGTLLLLPLRREYILLMAEFSWPIFSLKVSLVLSFQEQHNIIKTNPTFSNYTKILNTKPRKVQLPLSLHHNILVFWPSETHVHFHLAQFF